MSLNATPSTITVRLDGTSNHMPDRWRCAVCESVYKALPDAVRCCASAKRARQARVDKLIAAHDRKACELERIEEELEAVGVV